MWASSSADDTVWGFKCILVSKCAKDCIFSFKTMFGYGFFIMCIETVSLKLY